MERKSKLVFLSIFFAALYAFLIRAALTPTLPSPENPIIFYSNQNRDDLRLILKKIFTHARENIDITMYAITDPELLQILEKKNQTGVSVQIAYDPSSGSTSPLGRGIKTRGLMHRKIVVTDTSSIFIGSANMTTSSLVLHDNLSVGLYHPVLAAFLRAPTSSQFDFSLENQQGTLWLLPDPRVLNILKDRLSEAKTSIFVAMFTLTHPDLLTTLSDAHQRGIDVTVALDHYSARGASHKAVQFLQSRGIDVIFSLGQQLLHHKWALIDDQEIIFGSTNWTKAAFTKNQDCLLSLRPLTQEQRHFFHELQATIRLESNQKL